MESVVGVVVVFFFVYCSPGEMVATIRIPGFPIRVIELNCFLLVVHISGVSRGRGREIREKSKCLILEEWQVIKPKVLPCKFGS